MKFCKFFYRIDLFQRPVSFQIKGHDTLSSKLGVFISFLIYTYVIYTISTSDIYQKKHPTIYTADTSSITRANIPFESKLLAMIISDENGAIFIDPSIVSIKVIFYRIFQ